MKAQDKDTSGYVPKSELDFNALSLMGASPTAMQITKLLGQGKLKSADVTKLLASAGDMCYLAALPDSF